MTELFREEKAMILKLFGSEEDAPGMS